MTHFTALNTPQQPQPNSDSESDSAMSEVSQSRRPESDSESDSSMSAASELPKKLETSAASGSTSGCTMFHPREKSRRVKQYVGVVMYSDTHTMNSDSEDNQKDITFKSDGSVYELASQK